MYKYLNFNLGRGRPAKLILTKEQLSIQIHGEVGDDLSLVSADVFDSSLSNKPRIVNVPKTREGLGLSIKGGNMDGNSVPIIVSKVLSDLPAAQTGQIFVGDTIIEINGVNVENKTHEEVVNMLRVAPEPHVTLTLKHNSQVSFSLLLLTIRF